MNSGAPMGAWGAKALVPEAARGADELCWEARGMLKGSLSGVPQGMLAGACGVASGVVCESMGALCCALIGSLCCALNGALGCVPAESCGARGIGMFGGWNTLGA